VESMQSASGTLATHPGWVWGVLRFVGAYLIWGLMIALIGLAACWCCGYGAYAAWLRTHPPARHLRDTDVEVTLAEEAARGIAELEAFLAAAPDLTIEIEAFLAAQPDLTIEPQAKPRSDPQAEDSEES
jgi:hypothetical protein